MLTDRSTPFVHSGCTLQAVAQMEEGVSFHPVVGFSHIVELLYEELHLVITIKGERLKGR